jgi:hypothetical protein
MHRQPVFLHRQGAFFTQQKRYVLASLRQPRAKIPASCPGPYH